MTASSDPGPHDRDDLSAWERQVLARIEHDLSASDPDLARVMTTRRTTRSGAARWWPLSVRCTVLLFVVILLLVVAGVFVPASWWAVLGVITAVVVIPWLLLCATERRGAG
jgi:hypothetical protein